MTNVKIVLLRRWAWCPWFKETWYVPLPNGVDNGQTLPRFNNLWAAEMSAYIIEINASLSRIRKRMT